MLWDIIFFLLACDNKVEKKEIVVVHFEVLICCDDLPHWGTHWINTEWVRIAWPLATN